MSAYHLTRTPCKSSSIAKIYKNLTPEEKATWEARSQQDRKGRPKNLSLPKRASGAYVFFTDEMRPKVLQDFPNIRFAELGRELGKRWRALSPEEKKRYEDMAAEDKIRFQMEMQQYTASQGEAGTGPCPT